METGRNNYNELAKRTTAVLELSGSPVAIALSDEVPSSLEKGKEARHCELVQRARLEKSEFYTTIHEQKCKGGAAVMGLMSIPENVKNGEFYYRLGAFESLEASKRTMDLLPKVANRARTILYAPLESATFPPHIIIVICSPKQAMQIVQADLYREGGRIGTGFAGKQSLCGDIVAHTLNSNSLQVSLACSGSRGHSGVKDGELIVGIPAERLEQLVDSLERLFMK